ncbi:MAG: hypothetical protein Q9171_002295 [Xanthocarpia ochracea]
MWKPLKSMDFKMTEGLHGANEGLPKGRGDPEALFDSAPEMYDDGVAPESRTSAVMWLRMTIAAFSRLANVGPQDGHSREERVIGLGRNYDAEEAVLCAPLPSPTNCTGRSR